MDYIPWDERKDVVFADLIGVTFSKVEMSADNTEIHFETTDGRHLWMYHEQDCCESVYVESVTGDLADLVGHPLTLAEAVAGETPADYKFEYEPESYTWTFYKFATVKGYVDIRWLGQSNGYYGEGVTFIERVQPAADDA